MKSIRVLMFGFFPLIAVACLIATDVRRSTIATADWRDLTITGRGYIHTVDDRGANPIWFRSIRLGINQDGMLCAIVPGELRPIEPPIHVPSGWTRIDIDTNGRVTIKDAGSADLSIGSIPLSTFPGEDLADANEISQPIDRMGTPLVGEPGTSGAGYLMQGAAFQHSLPVTTKTTMASLFAALWMAFAFRPIRNLELLFWGSSAESASEIRSS